MYRKMEVKQKAEFKVPPGGFRGGFKGRAGGQLQEIRWKRSGMNRLLKLI